MPELSGRNIIEHRFHVKNDKGESCIGYDMIIGRDLMVQLGLPVDFKCQVLQWDDLIVPMKEPSGIIGKSDLTSHGMREVVMQTAEPASTREATEILEKILDNNSAKSRP